MKRPIRGPLIFRGSLTVEGPVSQRGPDDQRAPDRRGSRGGGRWVRHPPLERRDPRRRRWSLLKRESRGRKKGHWYPLNGCSTPFKHNIAINILKSWKSVSAYVKNRSSPSHIRSSMPWRPTLAEILDLRLPDVQRASDFIGYRPEEIHTAAGVMYG